MNGSEKLYLKKEKEIRLSLCNVHNKSTLPCNSSSDTIEIIHCRKGSKTSGRSRKKIISL